MNIKSAALYHYLIRFLYVQLFITLGSLPILICWGLPLSVMSPLANLIFTPLLMAFLLLSSLLFFAELLHLPNSWLVYLLEYLVHSWRSLLAFHTQGWLISLKQPSLLVLLLLVASAFFILHYTKSMVRAIWSFLLLLYLFIGYLAWLQESSAYLELPCNRGTVTVMKKEDGLVFIDPGYLGHYASTPSWIEYTLAPTLHKKFGSICLEHVIIAQPSILTFEAVCALCMHLQVKNLYLISWQGNGSKKLYRAYGQVKKIVEQKNITLHRLGIYKKQIGSAITITPLEKRLAYQDITFPALHIQTQVDKQDINFYSAKMKK
ncbi:MAG: hypothetical protein AB7R69_04205 [Candidatus Babeliales bacterium]